MNDIGTGIDIDIDITSCSFDSASSMLHDSICNLQNWSIRKPVVESRPELLQLCNSASYTSLPEEY